MQRISIHQYLMVLTAVLLGTTFFPIAQIVARAAGRDAWMSVLPGFLIGMPLFWLLLTLAQRYPGKNLLEITREVLGKWIGKGFGLLLTVISVYFGSLLLLQVADTWERTVQPFGSPYLHLGGTIILVIALCWAGIEVYARFAEVVFPLVVISIGITILLCIPRFEWDQMYPLLENGIKPVVMAGLNVIPFVAEGLLFLGGLLPFLPQGKNMIKGLCRGPLIALLTVGIINTFVVFSQVIIFGPVEAERLNNGLLVVASMVEVAHTIAGVESLFMIIWLGANILKVGTFFFLSIWGLQYVLGKQPTALWYGILGIAFFVIGIYGPQQVILVFETRLMDNYVIAPFAVLWIGLVWGVDYLKRRRAK